MSKDYSEYIDHRARLLNVTALLCGFTFTATIILVTTLPEPIQLYPQLTLLFSAILLDLFVLLLLLNMVNMYFLIEDIPEPTMTTNFISVTSVVTIGLWGYLLPIIFLIYELGLLSIASGIIWTIILAFGIRFIWTPFEKRRKSFKKKDESIRH